MYNLSIFSTLHSFYVGTMCYTNDIFTRFESTPHRWGITDRSPGPQTYRPSSKSWHETGLFRREFFVVQKHERVKLFHMIWTIKSLGSKRGKICQTRFFSDSFGSLPRFFPPKIFRSQMLAFRGTQMRGSRASRCIVVFTVLGFSSAFVGAPTGHARDVSWLYIYIWIIYGLSWYMMELSYVIMNSTLENRFFIQHEIFCPKKFKPDSFTIFHGIVMESASFLSCLPCLSFLSPLLSEFLLVSFSVRHLLASDTLHGVQQGCVLGFRLNPEWKLLLGPRRVLDIVSLKQC